MKKLITVGLVVTLGTLAIHASPSSSAPQWGGLGRATQTPIEHQTQGGATQPNQALWVTGQNVTGPDGERCVWDADEWVESSVVGRWRAGQSATFRWCFVNDHSGQLVRGWVSSGKLRLTLRIYDSLEPSRSWSWSGRSVCAFTELDPVNPPGQAPYADPLPYDWQRFPNTGAGGIGRVWVAEWTVTAVVNTNQDHGHAKAHHYGDVAQLNAFCGGQVSTFERDHLPRVYVDGLLVEDTGIDVRHRQT